MGYFSDVDAWVFVFPVTFRWLTVQSVHYGFEFGVRYSVPAGIDLDLINEEHGVAKAIVYGVNFVIAFQRAWWEPAISKSGR